MLVNRTNILFDNKTMHILKKLAAEQKTSVGKLVRVAVREKYLENSLHQRKRNAIRHTLQIRPMVSKHPIEYKELIAYGRTE